MHPGHPGDVGPGPATSQGEDQRLPAVHGDEGLAEPLGGDELCPVGSRRRREGREQVRNRRCGERVIAGEDEHGQVAVLAEVGEAGVDTAEQTIAEEPALG